MLVRGLEAELASPKYARVEFERRWLVDRALRPAVDALDAALIEDRYLVGTRVRLRRMTRNDGSAERKLTKKYDCGRSDARPIVTAYITESEHTVFATLPAHTLRKRRLRVRHDGRDWSLDLFEGSLAGLELLEVEAADEAALAALVPPPWATKEITHDPRYECGSLAQSDAFPE
jgi:CYTH domain-containing protein